jgi:hypothetical protein
MSGSMANGMRLVNNYRKCSIEEDLLRKRIDTHARREQSIWHGHVSALLISWPRQLSRTEGLRSARHSGLIVSKQAFRDKVAM